ncbi:hypothetical protein GCM10027402_15410 [Arthrobacter monumenti]
MMRQIGCLDLVLPWFVDPQAGISSHDVWVSPPRPAGYYGIAGWNFVHRHELLRLGAGTQ